MSMLDTALSGLRTAQSLIGVTTNNIANANTDGYVKQRADIGTRGRVDYQPGAEIQRIRRDVPIELQAQAREDTARAASATVIKEGAARVEQVIGDPETGLNATMNSLFSAAQVMSQDPSNTSSRQSFISQASSTASRINQMSYQLDREEQYVRAQMDISADRVNELTQELGELNRLIGEDNNRTEPALQLLDERDQVLAELTNLTGAEIHYPNDRNVTVYIGGSLIVSGSTVRDLSVEPSATDPTRNELVIKSNGTTVGYIPNSRLGGEMGGLNDYLNDMVISTRNELGQLSLGLADAMNQTLGAGVDLNNDLGSPLFSDINSAENVNGRVVPNLNNTGTGAIATTITDTRALTGKDYSLKIDSGNYTVVDNSGNVVTSGALGATSTDIAFDGVNLALGGAVTFASGDRFSIQPTRRAGENMSVVMTNPDHLGLAAPVLESDNLSNTGSGVVKFGAVLATGAGTDISASPAGLSPELGVEFTAGNTYRVYDLASPGADLWTGTYTPGSEINLFSSTTTDATYTGYTATVSGVPAVGDTFNFEFNADAVGDNRNAQRLTGVQEQNWLNNGQDRFVDAYSGLVSSVGNKTVLANIRADSAQALADASMTSLTDKTGVNLDEEAANLVQYQQYYQANAQVISVANELFDTLISSLR